jgi:hypothetical protein
MAIAQAVVMLPDDLAADDPQSYELARGALRQLAGGREPGAVELMELTDQAKAALVGRGIPEDANCALFQTDFPDQETP